MRSAWTAAILRAGGAIAVIYAVALLTTQGEARTSTARSDGHAQMLEEAVSKALAIPAENQTLDYTQFPGASAPLKPRPTQYNPTSPAQAVAAASKTPTPTPTEQQDEEDDELSSVVSAISPGGSRTTATQQQAPAARIKTYGAINVIPYENAPHGSNLGLEMRLTHTDNVRHFVDIALLNGEGKEVNRVETIVFPNDAIVVITEGLPAGSYLVNVLEKNGVIGEGRSIADVALSIKEQSNRRTIYRQAPEGLPERGVTIRFYENNKEATGIAAEVWYGPSVALAS